GEHAPRKRDRALGDVAFDDLVDEAVVERLRGRDRIAAQNHRQRLVDADQARKPLGAAGTGQDAELDLRQAESGRGRGGAIVAGKGDLEAAAERCAEQGRDDFWLASMRPSTSTSPGGCGGLSSSVMSAPAMKVRPAAVSTIARMLASSRARVKASLSPARTACLRALTGGLSTTMTATTPGRSSTMLDKAFSIPPGARAAGRLSGLS